MHGFGNLIRDESTIYNADTEMRNYFAITVFGINYLSIHDRSLKKSSSFLSKEKEDNCYSELRGNRMNR